MDINKIKNYEDICQIDGVDPVQSLPFPEAKTEEEKVLNFFAKAMRICRVLNEGWVPDWNNSSQWKYYPWFYMKGAFSFRGYNYDSGNSNVSSRLCFKNSDLAKFAGTTFVNIYKGFMVIEK